MADATIGVDAFARTLEDLLQNVGDEVKAHAPEAVEKALQIGEDEWRENANAVLSSSYSRGGWGKVRTTYKSGKRKGQAREWYGRTIKTGKYARSIRHQMLQGGDEPTGEIGSRSMPGLAHLLEKGHASVGGGKVPEYEHIAPAAEKAFGDFEELIAEAVEEAMEGA